MHLPTIPSDRRFRVLIVDDDPAIVRLAAVHLKIAGLAVFAARDGLEAWNQLPQVQPHLILTALKMPHLSGHELVKRVRRASAVPIVMMTAQDADEAQVQGFKLGADGYIAKPFTPQLLTTRIGASLRRVYCYSDSRTNGPITRVNASVALSAPKTACPNPSGQALPQQVLPRAPALPRGFVRCDCCGYIGPEWKFETRDSQSNVVERCPHCHNKEKTFALG